jgi:DNA-binding transcriptional regulator YhcF (GntR family)
VVDPTPSRRQMVAILAAHAQLAEAVGVNVKTLRRAFRDKIAYGSASVSA